MHPPPPAAEMAREFVADFDGDLVDEAGQGWVAQSRHQVFHRDSVIGEAVGLSLGSTRFRTAVLPPLGEIEGKPLSGPHAGSGVARAPSHEVQPARPLGSGQRPKLRLEGPAILFRRLFTLCTSIVSVA